MRDHVDDLLDRSSPRTATITDDVRIEIVRLHAGTERLSRSLHARRWMRPTVAGFAAAVLVGGVATAAAASGLWTLPWAATNAVASYTYTAPSEVRCEQRIGGVSGMDADEIAAVENFFRTVDFDALLTPERIEQTLARRQASEPVFVNDDGSTEPAGAGTKHFDPDEEYQMAVWDVVVTAMHAQLERHGIDGIETGLTFQGETVCAGAEG